MASIISEELDYFNKNPDCQPSFGKIEHALSHLGYRKKMSKVVAFTSTILAIIALAGLLGAGHIVFGAMAAVALVAFVYSHFCEEAESALRSKQVISLRKEQE